MNPKFQTTEDLAAIEYLMDGTEGECTARLISRYYEYREYGMSVDDSVVRSELSHIYYDHDGAEKVQSTIPLTVEFVHERIAESAKEEEEHPLIRARNIPIGEKVQICTELFDKYVSWGFSCAFSLTMAVDVARETIDEKYPITDEISYEYLATFPNEVIRDAMTDAYRVTREQHPDAPGTELLQVVMEFGEKAFMLQEMFGPAKGYSVGRGE